MVYWKSTISIVVLVASRASWAGEIHFESEVKIKRNSNSFEQVDAGKAIKYERGDVFLISNSRGLPMLLVAPKGSDSSVTVHEADMDELIRPHLIKATNSAVNEVIDGIRKTESLLVKHNYSDAQGVIGPLRAKYGSVAAVLFMNATVSYLSNNRGTAVEDLEKGLQIDPQNATALNLLKKLKEGR